MTTPRGLLAVLFGIAAQACATGGPSQPMDPPDLPALVVEVVATQVTVAGISFEDAVVTLMNRSVVQLKPSNPGGRIRCGEYDTVDFGTTVPRPAQSAGVHESEAMECLASSATIRRLSASIVEVELEDVAMKDAKGSRLHMDKLRVSIEEDGISSMDADSIDRSGSEAER